jgi:thiol-disulfide isomerase/thioredoxin
MSASGFAFGAAVTLVLGVASGCKSAESGGDAPATVTTGAATGQGGQPQAASREASGSSAASAAPDRIRIVAAPADGAVDAVVASTLAEARAAKRTLVVYVGATWCEPCQRFHHAAERGELDASFPTVTLLEFDLDRDRERLASAGYVSKYIPLFALPGPDGKASGKQIEGGIKGEGAVGFIAPRLKEMLSD